MAPEQAAGKRVDDRATSTASRSCSTRRSRASTRCAPARPRPPRAASAPCSRRCGAPQGPAAGAVRGDRPRAAPEARRARHARRARRRARRGAAGGLRRGRRTVAPHPLERGRAAPARRGPASLRRRAGGRPRRRGARLGSGSRSCPRSAAAAAVAVLPAARLAGSPRSRRSPRCRAEHPGAALLAAAALAPVPLLLRRHGTTWSVPALAPLLGLATLAGAYPGARRPRAAGRFTRAALGALGAWWALLAAPLLGRALLDRGPALAAAGASADGRSTTCCAPLLAGGALLYAALWAVAALAPALARPRPLARARRRRRLRLGRRARGRNGRDSRGDRRSRAARTRAGERPRGRARGRDPTPPASSGGGAVTPGRILCTGNHGHHHPRSGA